MPEYTSKLYGFLAQNDPEFSKKLSESQFTSKLSTDSNYSKKMYDFLAQNDPEFSKKLDYNQFQVKTNLKKKVSTEVSKPSVGSSGTTETPQKQSSDSSKQDGIYKYQGNLKANYKKENGQWYIDPTGGTKFQPLKQGDVAKRVKILESQAKYDMDLTAYNMPNVENYKVISIEGGGVIDARVKGEETEKYKDIAKAKVFTGLTGKEENKYRVVDNIWQRSVPNEKGEYSDWTTITSEGAIKTLNAKFKQNAGLDVVKTKQEYSKLGFKDINSNLIGGDEVDAVKYLTDRYGNLGFKFEEGLGDQMIVRSPIRGVKPLTIDMDSFDSEKDANNAAILRAYLSQNALTKEREKEESFVENYQNIALDRTGNTYVDETKRLAELESGKLNIPETELQQSLNQQKKNEKIQQLEKETGLSMRQIQDERARKAKIYGESKVFKGDLTAAAIAEQNKVNKVYVNNEIKDINLRNKLSLRLSEQFDNDLADFKANYDTYTEEERAIKEADLKQKATELKEVYDQNNKDSSHINYLIQSQAKSAISSKIVAEKTGTVAGAIGRSLTDAIIDSGTGVYQSLGGLIFDESPITTKERQEVKDNIAKIFTTTTSEFTASEDRSLMTSTIVALTQMAPAVIGNLVTRGAASKLTGVAGKVASNAAGSAYFWGMGYSNAYDSMEGMNIADDDKRKLSFAIASATAVLESYGLEKITSNKAASGFVAKRVARVLSGLPKEATMEMMNNAIYADMKKIVADKLIKITSKGIIEGGVEVSQSAAETGIKELYDTTREKEVFTDDWGSFGKNALKEFLVGSFAGATVNAMSGLGTTVQQLRDPENFGLSKEIATDEDLQDLFKNDLKSKIIQGEMTIPEAKAKLRAVGEFKALLGKVPSDMLETNQQEAMKLIEEKQKLQRDIEGKEPALVEEQKQRIADIDNEMKQLVEDDAKGEIRITARGLDQVPEQFRDRAIYRGTSKAGRFGKTTKDYVYTITRDEYNKLQENAVQERSTEEVLPREQDQAGEAGGQRERMGQSIKGEEVTQEGITEENPLSSVKATAKALNNNLVQKIQDESGQLFPLSLDEDQDIFNRLSERYHEAKQNGNDPDLVNAFEKVLGGKQVTQEGTKEEVEFEDIVIPQNELDVLNEELSRKKDEGTINDNLDQAGYIGDEYGTIRIDPENENTIVFETNSKIIVLGTVDEVKDSDISSFGISLFPQTEVKADNESNAVTLDGKKYKIIGRRRDKKGKAVVRVKELETGLERRIIGEKAEQILKDQALAKDKKPGVTLKLATEGKEPVINNKKREKKEEAKKAKEEFEAKTLEELKAEEDRLEKEVKDFEDNLLQEIANESKKEKKLTFKIKDAEFTVSEKSDGTYSVSQKNENGKFVGIKDEAKRKAAISEYKKTRESNDTNRLNLATELTEDFKREKDDKILAWLDRAIAATSIKGKMFNFSGGAFQMAANTSLKIIRASYKAGKSLTEAIKDGYKFMKDNNIEMSEYDYKKFVAENINKQVDKETEEQETVKPTKKPVATKDMNALKQEIKAYFKGKRDSKKEIVSVIKNISDAIKAMVTDGQMKQMQFKYIMNKLSRVNFSKQESIDEFIDYVFNKIMDAEYVKKISTIDKINRAIRRNKSMVAEISELSKQFSKIRPELVGNIDAHLALAKQIKQSLARYTKTKDEIEFRKNVNVAALSKYIENNKDKILNPVEKTLENTYEKVFGSKSSAGKTDQEMMDELAKAAESKIEAIRNAAKIELAALRETIEEDEDAPDVVKRAAKVDMNYLTFDNAVEFINALSMYVDNGIVSGLTKLVEKYEGRKAVRESKIRFSKLKSLSGGFIGRGYNRLFSPTDMIIAKKQNKKGQADEFKKESKSSEVQEGYNKGDIETNKKKKSYNDKFKKIKNFFEANNKAERALFAFVQRNVLDDAKKADEFLRRKELVAESIKQLRDGRSKKTFLMAELTEKVAKKLGILNEDGTVNKSITIDEIRKNTEAYNVSAVKWMQAMHAEKFAEFADHALGFHNILLDREDFYTTDRFSSVKSEKQDEDGNPITFDFLKFTGMVIKEAGSFMTAKRPSKLNGRFINLDFEENNFGSHKAMLHDLYTSAAKQFHNAYRFDEKGDYSKEFADIMGRDKYGSPDAELYNKSYNTYLQAKENKVAPDEETVRKAKVFLNGFGKITSAATLGGIKNIAAQTVPIYTDAIISNHGILGLIDEGNWMEIIYDSFDKRSMKLIEAADSQVATRGSDVFMFNEKVEKQIKERTRLAKLSNKAVSLPVIASEVIMEVTNQYGDKLSAVGVWMNNYKKYCKDNNIDFDYDNLNKDAARFAENKTKIQILSSDSAERGALGANNTIVMSILRQVFFPYSSFSLNSKSRIYKDVLNIVNSSWSTREGFDLKKEAANDLISVGTSLVVFQAIGYYWRILVGKMLINGFMELYGLVMDDDEEEEMMKKLKQVSAKISAGQGVNDVFSPLPTLDFFVTKGVNYLVSAGNLFGATEEGWMTELRKINKERYNEDKEYLTPEEEAKEKAKYFDDNAFQLFSKDEVAYLEQFGGLGILASKAIGMYDIAKSGFTGKYMNDYKGNITEKTLTKEAQEAVKALAYAKSTAILFPSADILNITDKAFKMVGREFSFTDTQISNLEQVKSDGYKVDKYTEKLAKIKKTASSIEAELDNMYGMSPRKKELYIKSLRGGGD